MRAVPSTSLPAGQPNPITSLLSSLRASSATSRAREEFALLEEESPMKKLRPADDSSKSFKINLVKVAGEDLHHVDEELPSVAEEVDEEDWEEEGDEEEADEVNGPECLWRDGEHGPEEDPEEWIGRVADEVEEKRLQKMQALERSEGSKEGISHLTTRNMYDWRKKRYHREAGTTSKRWKRRPRLIARECAFAEGKRDDISHQRLQDMY